MQLREKLLAAVLTTRKDGVVEEWVEGSKRIVVVLRSDGDIQVDFHIAGKAGAPFEQLFVLPGGEEEMVVDEVCDFVNDLLDEKIVLAVDGRLVRGGQRWLRPAELGETKHFEFLASWRGSFDSGPLRS